MWSYVLHTQQGGGGKAPDLHLPFITKGPATLDTLFAWSHWAQVACERIDLETVRQLLIIVHQLSEDELT